MSDERDDELAARMRDVASQAGRAVNGRSATALDRAMRRRRNVLAAQAALATVLAVAGVAVVPGWFDDGRPGTVLSGGEESPSATPEPEPSGSPSVSPEPPPDAPAPQPTPAPSKTPEREQSSRPSPTPEATVTAETTARERTMGPSPLAWPCQTPRSDEKPDGVSVTLDLSATAADNGEQVAFTVTFRNDGPNTLTYDHGSNYYDLVLVDASGTRYVFSHGRAYTTELRRANHPPGTVQEASDRFLVQGCGEPSGTTHPSPDLPPGTYRAYGLWAAPDGFWWSDAVPFTVR